jgi:ATPase family associated with various cellular activities (AAA)
MADELDLGFDDLVTYRQQLRTFCSLHYSSLIGFRQGKSFKLNESEVLDDRKVHNLTSSATCLASLLDCPTVLLPPNAKAELTALASEFSMLALRRPQKRWVSEESASVYCRCRTLPFIVEHAPNYDHVICAHLEHILWQVANDPKRLAIGEASKDDGPNPANWYPENAFYTYWTFYLLSVIEQRFPSDFAKIPNKWRLSGIDIDRLRAEMLTWARHTAGYQSALHASGSPTLDSDQLAWSLTILARFGEDFQADLPKQDFLRYAFKCLFEQQNASGIWRRGAALFHYRNSGNAYCYVFETIAVLLQSALTNRPESLFLRKVLSPYAGRLIRLWRYATLTQIPLTGGGKRRGWSSGHRVLRKEPESWATASVFSYAQSLRRLIGIWAREAAGSDLHVSTTHRSAADALRDLRDRGDTWSSRDRSAATQLITSFVNPIVFSGSNNQLEPDSLVIEDTQARGAILFGPPGTSKTTLCRAVADAIDWDYVELHASHFVAEGLTKVQLTANRIFDQLMQLDHTVILFDEIDELVRARDVEPDAFGRFLTTSMLPKLAQLWKGRKVIYFIATNDIRFFDPAVTRAERFDLVIQVPPPSFERKVARLLTLLASVSPGFTRVDFTKDDVEQALRLAADADKGDRQKPTPLPAECVLAKFLLLRWDQLHELAAVIAQVPRNKNTEKLTRNLMEDALTKVADPFLSSCGLYKRFIEAGKYEQHDFNKIALWEIEGAGSPRAQNKNIDQAGRRWYRWDPMFDDMNTIGADCKVKYPGVMHCSRKPRRRTKRAKTSGPRKQ